MKLQFVFGNPAKGKKNRKKTSKGGAVAKKRRKKTKRNPEKFSVKVREYTGDVKTKAGKTRKKYKTVHKQSVNGPVMTRGEIAAAKASIRIAKEKARGIRGKKRKAILSKIASVKAKLDKGIAKRKDVKEQVEMIKENVKLAAVQSGKKADVVSTSAKWYEKSSKKKKKAKKKKASKKKASRKAKKSTKRKGRKKKATKRITSVRRAILKRRGSKVRVSSGKGKGWPGITVIKASKNPKRKGRKGSRRKSRKINLKKGQSILLGLSKGKRKSTYRIKANPLGGIMDQFEQYTGHSIAEAGSLALGGALYGAVNGMTAKYAKPVHAALTKVPVVGTSLPTLLIGAIANYIGEQRNIPALKTFGKGLVGASVVGMGVNASRMVPGLQALSGVDYTMEGLGEGGEADFGYGTLPEGMGEGGEADFGGVDYTMEGVDYTMEGYGDDGQMGDDADFGDDDFASVPEGMGEGQMG